MRTLASIKQYGILSPLIVRPIPEGVYEIISGHRRKYAAQQLGYRKVPVIIRAMKDDEAVISMIDANLQREQIRPSEKAFAYKMKYDAIKRRSGRRKKDAIPGRRIPPEITRSQLLNRKFPMIRLRKRQIRMQTKRQQMQRF